MFTNGASLQNFYEKLKASYWFIPGLMAIGAVLLSLIMVTIDQYVGDDWLGQFTWFYANQPDGARAVLSAIAGSMITVASVTFSMTITAVAFATGQIGPRLISNFMRDRTNQITLGTFIATFMYSLMVLRTIVSASEAQDSDLSYDAFVPHFSILVAMFLAMASVAVLIRYIHHIPESINISNIISGVGQDLINAIARRFPRELDEKLDPRTKARHPYVVDKMQEDAKAVTSPRAGYVQVLDENALKSIAKKHDLRLLLQYRPGDFALKGDILIHAAPKQLMTDDIAAELTACFAFGHERTQTQDILFMADELVEIIARALSPGINDPFTAISAMDWLYYALDEMAGRDIPGPYYYDEEGHLRLIVHAITFEKFIDTIFQKMRSYVASDRNAALHAIKILGEMILRMPEGPKRDYVLAHAEYMNNASAEVLSLESDRQDMAERLRLIKNCLDDENAHFAARNDIGWLGGSA